MSDPRDYILDIKGLADATPAAAKAKPPVASTGARPFLSVFFKCCSVYQRVYRNADNKTYTGRCPKCLAQIRFVVGEGGTGERSFVVE